VTGVVVDLRRLARKRERARRTWLQVQGLLARRRDLVPDLSHAVRGYAPHEHVLLDAVAAAREAAITAKATGQPATMAAAEQHLDRAVRSLLALADTIPALATTEHHRDLRANFVVLDVRLAHCAGDYNAPVEDFNSALRHTPTTVIAAVGGYRRSRRTRPAHRWPKLHDRTARSRTHRVARREPAPQLYLGNPGIDGPPCGRQQAPSAGRFARREQDENEVAGVRYARTGRSAPALRRRAGEPTAS
jgi:LemA protein